LTACTWTTVNDARIFAVSGAAKFFSDTASANVTRAAGRKAVQNLHLFNGQSTLSPSLLKSGAAHDGCTDGGLQKITTIGHVCLL
jgi:hypothetical protein